MRHAVDSPQMLPPVEWVGGGTLKRCGLRHGGPAYAGTLIVEGVERAVELFQILDGKGIDCLSFSPEGTSAGVLWPARDKLNGHSPDYFGTMLIDEQRWRLRGWRDANGIRVRVKA